MDLSTRATAQEQMDAEDLSPAIYARVLAGLARVNVATLAARPTVGFLARAMQGRNAFRLLDVGYGDGDMLRTLARWAQRHGKACELVGIDLNPRSEDIARARHPAGAPIAYRTGDYADLVNEPWDIIVSSLVTHHMSDEQRLSFLTFMETHARMGWFVNDLHRHAFAYYGFPLLARLLAVHRIVREDGQLSIARSFRPAEWQAMLVQAGLDGVAHVRRLFPFRLCVERIR
ncbi:methyltransferase domain-containing protein [Sphingobium subterraneum]|uniref:2-polyprenyl-3-methyl-5-hydroxy-6-metoxy-1, 4-benzoquinol methylase n=1 Tax=Sphingobium subterraneum TaxID=627688 RepID=A0A841J174_9SPHN|nr:methyltransferase domain-containing protein [Sphingobium subterraneum]MBB6124102.1 2-polyprenyl-3-methyl-5-hydroxy-6-metoxy-1,4-benzoquinol methylase [Sphingobium subterraneum]